MADFNAEELQLEKDFASAAAAAMTLRELVDAWDRICMPRMHLISHAARDQLRKTYDATRQSLSGA